MLGGSKLPVMGRSELALLLCVRNAAQILPTGAHGCWTTPGATLKPCDSQDSRVLCYNRLSLKLEPLKKEG